MHPLHRQYANLSITTPKPARNPSTHLSIPVNTTALQRAPSITTPLTNHEPNTPTPTYQHPTHTPAATENHTLPHAPTPNINSPKHTTTIIISLKDITL